MKELVKNTPGFFRVIAYLTGVNRETWLQKCPCKLGLHEQKHRTQNKGNSCLLYFLGVWNVFGTSCLNLGTTF